tara:strand:- start:891 stop:1697 length:807 start_codon:yes stop_codon:yes gene_type:complete
MAFVAITAGVGAAASITIAAIKNKKAKDAQQKAEEKEQKMMRAYESLDTSNLYEGMENSMEDLTINQEQSKFQQNAIRANQADTLSTLKASAGSSGIAALAQASQGRANIASQKASISIGQQERQNSMASAQMASKVQAMKAQGAGQARSLEYGKTSTMLGMAQQQLAGANAQKANAEAELMSGIQAGVGVIGGVAAAKRAGGDFAEDFTRFNEAAMQTMPDMSGLTSAPITAPSVGVGFQNSNFSQVGISDPKNNPYYVNLDFLKTN